MKPCEIAFVGLTGAKSGAHRPRWSAETNIASRPWPAVAVKIRPAASQSAALSAATVGAPVAIVSVVGAAAMIAVAAAFSVFCA